MRRRKFIVGFASTMTALPLVALGQQAGRPAERRHGASHQRVSAFEVPAQPVDSPPALTLSAGVSNCKVSRGRSFS